MLASVLCRALAVTRSGLGGKKKVLGGSPPVPPLLERTTLSRENTHGPRIPEYVLSTTAVRVRYMALHGTSPQANSRTLQRPCTVSERCLIACVHVPGHVATCPTTPPCQSRYVFSCHVMLCFCVMFVFSCNTKCTEVLSRPARQCSEVASSRACAPRAPLQDVMDARHGDARVVRPRGAVHFVPAKKKSARGLAPCTAPTRVHDAE